MSDHILAKRDDQESIDSEDESDQEPAIPVEGVDAQESNATDE